MAINYAAVVVAALISMVLGFLWYGPLFGKVWISLSRLTPQKLKPMKASTVKASYILAFISSLVMATVFASVLSYTNANTWTDGLVVGFWLWLGFIATKSLGSVLWEGKPIKLYCLNVTHDLVSLMLMGIILTIWA